MRLSEYSMNSIYNLRDLYYSNFDGDNEWTFFQWLIESDKRFLLNCVTY
jgi:hypothetical protein